MVIDVSVEIQTDVTGIRKSQKNAFQLDRHENASILISLTLVLEFRSQFSIFFHKINYSFLTCQKNVPMEFEIPHENVNIVDLVSRKKPKNTKL
jgi:hypothetical protein